MSLCLMCNGENLDVPDRDQLASCWAMQLEKRSKEITGLGRGQAATRKCQVKEQCSSSENNLSDPNSPTSYPRGSTLPQEREK